MLQGENQNVVKRSSSNMKRYIILLKRLRFALYGLEGLVGP